MLTTSVNTFAFSNLALICRNGTEAVGRLSKSPYITVRPSREQPKLKSNDIVLPTAVIGKKRSRAGSVRFSPEILEKSELSERNSTQRAKKRKRFDDSDAASWYSKGELRDIQRSCVVALHTRHANPSLPNNEDDDISSLDRFSPQNQKKRRLARCQVQETVRAVQAFEKATGTKAPREMLALLLQRYSTSRVIEANHKAIQTAENCALHHSR